MQPNVLETLEQDPHQILEEHSLGTSTYPGP